jgi:hypothetical protein
MRSKPVLPSGAFCPSHEPSAKGVPVTLKVENLLAVEYSKAR